MWYSDSIRSKEYIGIYGFFTVVSGRVIPTSLGKLKTGGEWREAKMAAAIVKPVCMVKGYDWFRLRKRSRSSGYSGLVHPEVTAQLEDRYGRKWQQAINALLVLSFETALGIASTSQYQANVPHILNIDRDKVQNMGIALNDVFSIHIGLAIREWLL